MKWKSDYRPSAHMTIWMVDGFSCIENNSFACKVQKYDDLTFFEYPEYGNKKLIPTNNIK